MKDGFGREIKYLRLSVTELCNLRCRYCMPEEGVPKRSHEEMLTEEEMMAAVRCAASVGIEKVRITGGEPLVKKNILSICRRITAVEGIRELCITTNGIYLPALAEDLVKAGVSRINISLDTLDAEKYAYMTRTGNLSEAVAGIRAALNAGFARVKINCVLIGGFNDTEVPAMAELTMHYPIDVRFIELMPMPGGGEFGESAYIPYTSVLAQLPEAVELPNDHGVAKLYKLPGAMGHIGLISPVSSHFCSDCNRIRLTADGKLKPCLHSAEEIPLKGLSESAMREQMIKAISDKPARHDPLSRENRSHAARSMNRIGG